MTPPPPTTTHFLFKNGVVHPSPPPPITTFLETHPGAYTTTRTHNNATCLLFWARHLTRLSNSLRILLSSNPTLLSGGPHLHHPTPNWDPTSSLRHRVGADVSKALPFALKERDSGHELTISTLIGGPSLDVYVHIGMYVPPVFGDSGARLAVVGSRRDFAEAKYSDWVRLRKPLEKLRPPSVTELLLSDDGDRILEGSVTNFFVVCLKENSEVNEGSLDSYEVQTAPVKDGVLPGVIRQLVIEVCLNLGLPIREVSPSWSERHNWEEAFITNSLRLVQHVERIQAPSSWTSVESKSWSEISWVEKQFKASPGMVTSVIQREIMKKAELEGYSLVE